MPPRKLPQSINNVKINIAKINLSFIKAANHKHAFIDTQIDAQMNNNIHTVASISIYSHAKLEPCTNPSSRDRHI